MTLTRLTYGIPNKGKLSRIVGFSETTKGEIVDNMTTRTKYVVFVEQSGEYRMGRVRIEAWEPKRMNLSAIRDL